METPPPLRILVLGGGQLGRMLGLAAVPLGLQCTFVDAPDAPAGIVGPIVAGLTEVDAIRAAAQGATVATYEWEGVPTATVRALDGIVPVRPGMDALAVASDRLAEKQAFVELGVPVAPFVAVDHREELDDAVATVGLPAILKTRTGGYDGKGQRRLVTEVDVEPAWRELGGQPLILEGFVEFSRELSVLAARGLDGSTSVWPLVENLHVDGVLRVSRAPAPDVPPELQAIAASLATRLMERLDYVGVLAVELFQRGDELVANELAPRVHNSGHWTIEGAVTSQFEQHLRAILGWPLGSVATTGHSAMVNCLGAVPDAERVLAIPGAHLHDYGKARRPGRKVGHITLVAPTAAELDERLAELGRAVPGLLPPRSPAATTDGAT